jgi:ribonucleoside-diphosphate reductase alpha chain
MGPLHPHSDQVHAEKYRLPGEGFREAMNRVASGLTDNPQHFEKFRDALLGMRFMPAGRVQAAIGSPKHITPYNCFVSGTIHDSFVHGEDHTGRNSIMDIARQAAATMRMGGGIGYDWSTLRPSQDLIVGVQSQTDGPLAFMPIMDYTCKATSSAGNRRGAQMGVLRIDHPDILRFIHAKQPSDKIVALWEHVEDLPADFPGRTQLVMALQETLQLTGFNLSIGVTDEFMECLAAGRPFPLRFGGRVYNHVDPHELWETVMRSTWDWAEPGVLYIDSINRMNNLWYCETIAATNPCGEQPLPPYGACLLGSFNLARYVHPNTTLLATGPRWAFDWAQLARDIAPVVRAMDNVVDYAHYPLQEQEEEAKNKRRMGLGVTGLANAAEALGFAYGTPDFLQFEYRVLEMIKIGSYQASMELAQEKGAFPMFDADLYCQGEFIKTLPPSLVADIRRHGIRNSHLTSIAPTGTISYASDNVSSSIEPVFMLEGQRRMKTLQGDVIVDVYDYGYKAFGVEGKTADRVTAQEHVDVLATATEQVDSAVSKTCNVSPDMPWEDFKGLYVQAYDRGAKGCTTFNPGGKRLGIFIAKERKAVAEDDRAPELETAGSSCTFDPASGRRSCE